MPNGKSRRKGYMGELEARKLCKRQGFSVRWHPEDPTYPDITLDEKITCEIKYGTQIPKTLYKWFKEKGADVLLIRRVSKNDKMLPWLVVMKVDLFSTIAKKTPYKNPALPPNKKELKKSLDELRKEFGYKKGKSYEDYLEEDTERSKIKK